MLWSCCALIPILVAIVAHIAITSQLTDVEYTDDPFTIAAVREQFFASEPDPVTMSRTKSDVVPCGPVPTFDEATQRYRLGRCRSPYGTMNIPRNTTAAQKMLQHKEFVWLSLAKGPRIIGLAMLQFGYVGALVLNVYDSASEFSGKLKVEAPIGALRGIGPFWTPSTSGAIGPAAAGHCVEFRGDSTTASFCSQGAMANVFLRGTVVTANGPTVVEARWTMPIEGRESANMVFPIGPRRAALVSKVAGVPVDDGTVLLNGSAWLTADDRTTRAIAAMDYTRGLLRRDTRWYWLALGLVLEDGSPFGMQLSRGVYDYNNRSVENTLYLGDKVAFWDEVVAFTHIEGSRWIVTSKSLRLTFEGRDAHDGAFHYGLVRGNLKHMWGTFNGSLTLSGRETIHFNRVVGVLEDHYSLW